MTKEQLAALLHNRQYREEITKEERQAAKAAGLVVVFGRSDDLMEFAGAITDQVGTDAYITQDGQLYEPGCEDEDCPHEQKIRAACKTISAVWYDEEKVFHKPSGEPYSWTYKTDIPHTTFDIMEDGDPYCRGIVFSINDLNP